MRNQLLFVLLIVLSLSIGALIVVGCGDDDDDSGGGGGDDDDDNQGSSINAVVHDFQTKQPVADVVVELINNDTGESFDPPITVTSPADGWVTLPIPEGVTQVGIKCSKQGYKDSYQYYFDAGLTGEEFLIISDVTASLVAQILGIELDPAKGHFAGGLYWGSPTDEGHIGCGWIETDPPCDEIHYMGLDDLPNPARDVTGDTPTDGQGTNPANGYWVAMNFDTGPAVATGHSGEFSESVTIPVVRADSINITNIYFPKSEYPDNPTEDFCTE